MAGTTWTWIGTTSDPTVATNWSPNGHPQPGDTAIIPGGTTVPPNIVNTSVTGVTFDLVNDGTLAVSNTSASLSSSEIDAQGGIDATGSATALSIAGPFTNLGTIEVTGTQASLGILIAGGNEAPGILNNQGQIIVGPTDRLAINGGTILDPGTILVNGGTATIAGTLEGTGNYAVGTGGTLELDQAGSFASTQITFTGTTGLVKLDDPEAFDGSISGFALGDTIDLGPVNVSTVVFDNQGDVIAIGSGGTVFDANLPGSGNSGTFVLSGTGGVAGDLQLTEGSGDTVLTMVPPSTWLWSNGASAPGNTTSDWSVVSGPGNGWGYPQPGDTAIDAGGTIVLGDSDFEGDTLELGGTAGLAELSFTGSSNTNIDRPTLDSSSVITSDVTSVGTFVGNSTPETSLLNAQGIFINDGTIAADGPAGSSFTIAVSGTMIDGTFQPGDFVNYGLIQVDPGNTMTITVAGTSELFNAGEIVVDGGTLVYNAATNAIVGGYAPGSGVVFIEDGGTVETNVTYAADVNGNIPTYAFAGTGTGNTLKIDTIGSFGGAILGFEANDTIDIGTSIDVTAITYDNSTGILSLESGGTIAASLLLATGNFQNYSGTVSISGTTDGFIIGTSAADGDTIITTAVQNDVYDNTTGTWQTGGLWSSGVPGTLDTAVIGVGASAPFTLTTGASPVSVGALVLAGDNTLLQITSDTTASPYQIHEYGGTLEVTSGNTLTAPGMIVDGGQTTIDPTALLDLTGHQTYGTTGAIDGTITATSYGAQALRIDSGSFLVNGGTLDAGPGQAGGGTGGRIYIGFEGGGTPATMTVQNSGTDAGVVTDTYAILASDPTSFGILTLDGNVSWTDEIVSTDTQSNRGYMLVGFNNQATISGTFTPDFSGTATLVVENGATLTEQSYASIADSVDSSGSVLVSGAGALWSIGTTTTGSITGGFLNVARLGDGILTVEDGGIVEVGGSLEGFINNGSLLSASGIDVGVSAGSVGTLDIESGGTVAMLGDAGIGIGLSAEATGLIIVNGPGALLSEGTAGLGIAIGKAGTGTLEIEGGGTVDLNGTATTSGIGIGQTAGATGLVVVSGSGSLLELNTPDGSVHVGDAGQGTLEVESGATVSATGTGVVIGVDSGGSGTVTVSGAGSSLLSLGPSGGMIVGDAGAGILNVGTGTGSGGSVSTAARLLIANAGTATGTVTVDGGTLTVGGSLVVGNVGSGMLDVENGGVVTDTGTASVDIGGGSGGSGTVVVNDGTLTDTSGYFGVGNADASGTLLVDGGGTLITGGGNAISDINATGSGQTAVATVNGGTWDVNWQLIVGDTGTGLLDINSDGLVNAGSNFVDVGNQTGGSGTLSLESGGMLQAGSLTIDSDASLGATGHVTVAGGTVTLVGLSENANAAITVSSGSLSVSGTGLIGQQGTGAALTMTGGDATFGGLIVGYVPGTSGTVTVSGGLLHASGMIIGDGGDARVTVNTGGSLAVTNDLQLDNESDVSPGAGGTSALLINGGSMTVGGGLTIGEGGTASVTIEAGGTLAATSGNDFSIGGDLVAPGTAAVTVSDGRFTASGGALLIGDGGNASMLVENAGTVVTTYTGSGPGVEIDTPSTAQASVTVTGTGSVWDFDASGAQFVVGDTGGGSLTINDGGVVNAGTNTVDIGNQAGGSGSVEVQGGTLDGGDIVVGFGGSGTLEIATGGTVDVSSATVGLDGVLALAGGLLDPSAITLSAGGVISGFGTLEASLDNASTVTATGGALTVTGEVSGSGTMTIAAGAALDLTGTVLSGQIVDFTANTGVLQLGTFGTIAFSGTIGSGGQGDIQPGDTIILTGVTNAATAFVNPINNVLEVVLTNATTIDLQLDPTASFATDLFNVNTVGGNAVVTETGVPCFAGGTGIATPRGRKRVEELAVGDTVRTALDRRPRPIVWIGHRTVDCTRHPRPQFVWPVCVSAGAFGRGLPARDLYLSPDHAVYAGGVLIPVKRLVNGETVTQVPCDSVTYYHIELTRHDVVLAEGLPAESFLDTGDRANFANGGRPVALYPNFSSHVREAEGCAELIVVGPKLDAVRAKLDRIASGRRAASKRAA